jgi:hypothetical protein
MNPVATASYVGVDQRQSPRTDVYARVPVMLPDGRMVTVTVVNISADGLLMRCEHVLAIDSICTVTLPVIGRIKALTIWSIGGRSGVNFLQQIDARDYLPLLRALGARIGT